MPTSFTEAEGLAWIEPQWSRAENEEGVPLAIADARSDEALGVVVLLLRPQPGSAAIGYWVIERARGRRLASRAVALLAWWRRLGLRGWASAAAQTPVAAATAGDHDRPPSHGLVTGSGYGTPSQGRRNLRVFRRRWILSIGLTALLLCGCGSVDESGPRHPPATGGISASSSPGASV